MIENFKFTKFTFVKKFSSATCRKVPGNPMPVRGAQDQLSSAFLCKRRCGCQCGAPLMSWFLIDIKVRSASADNAEYLRAKLCPETTVFDSYYLLILKAFCFSPQRAFPNMMHCIYKLWSNSQWKWWQLSIECDPDFNAFHVCQWKLFTLHTSAL